MHPLYDIKNRFERVAIVSAQVSQRTQLPEGGISGNQKQKHWLSSPVRLLCNPQKCPIDGKVYQIWGMIVWEDSVTDDQILRTFIYAPYDLAFGQNSYYFKCWCVVNKAGQLKPI